jgi:hypothetical protein
MVACTPCSTNHVRKPAGSRRVLAWWPVSDAEARAARTRLACSLGSIMKRGLLGAAVAMSISMRFGRKFGPRPPIWTTTSNLDHDLRFGPRPPIWTTTSDLDHDLQFGPRPPIWTTTASIWTTTLGLWTTTSDLDHDPRFVWTTTSDLDHDRFDLDHDPRFGPRPPIWTTTSDLDHDLRFGPRP